MPWFVANWCKAHKDIILSWNDILVAWATLSNLGHLLRVISLRSEIEIIKLASRLNNKNHIIVKPFGVSLNKNELLSWGWVWKVGVSREVVFTMPVSCSKSGDLDRKVVLNLYLLKPYLNFFRGLRAKFRVRRKQKPPEESVRYIITRATKSSMIGPLSALTLRLLFTKWWFIIADFHTCITAHASGKVSIGQAVLPLDRISV